MEINIEDKEKLVNEGFCVIKNKINKLMQKKISRYLKVLESDKYKNLFNWQGLNGDNPYITNVNRQSFELYNIAYKMFFDIDDNNNFQKTNNNYTYLNTDCIKLLSNNDKKLYIEMMKWSYNYTIYIFKEYLKSVQMAFNSDFISINSIKIMFLHKNAYEQEIHIDGTQTSCYKCEKDESKWWGENSSFILSIPLNEYPKELNTIFYNNKKLKYKCNCYDRTILNTLDKLNDDIKYDFCNAREQHKLELTDFSMHSHKCWHQGPSNNTNIIRKILFIEIANIYKTDKIDKPINVNSCYYKQTNNINSLNNLNYNKRLKTLYTLFYEHHGFIYLKKYLSINIIDTLSKIINVYFDKHEVIIDGLNPQTKKGNYKRDSYTIYSDCNTYVIDESQLPKNKKR